MMKELSFFLGANTYGGFYSLYEAFGKAIAPKTVWVLKGGAGCGKSGFLRRVSKRAIEAGCSVSHILCSGDPASLDGVYLPELGVALFDGTNPHVMEPPQVGHRGFYIDLSRFYRPGVPELAEREAIYKEHYRRAYLWLAAAGAAETAVSLPEELRETLGQKARRLVARECRRKGEKRGSVTRWFTDAFTCEGAISLPETRAALCERQIGLVELCGAAACYLEAAQEALLERGWDVIACPSPLCPDRLAHLLVPELGLGLVSDRGNRRVHLDHLVYRTLDAEDAVNLREGAALRQALLGKAQRELKLAKHHHDQLEAAVNGFIDFPAVYALAEKVADHILATD